MKKYLWLFITILAASSTAHATLGINPRGTGTCTKSPGWKCNSYEVYGKFLLPNVAPNTNGAYDTMGIVTTIGAIVNTTYVGPTQVNLEAQVGVPLSINDAPFSFGIFGTGTLSVSPLPLITYKVQ